MDADKRIIVTNTLGAVPVAELTRSTAARRVAELATESELVVAHFEHRVRLPLPEAWCPDERPDLGEAPGWQAGVLPEAKYQSFCHDRRVASFHPGHRAKWMTHELCHGLVGFAWRPGASVLFHTLAARLAEVLPVALWYFFDELDLQRCPRHAGSGALFDLLCEPCEALAGTAHPRRPEAEALREQGRAFVARELSRTRESIATGTPLPSRWATLDLMSDGLAYAAAHGERLRSAEMGEFVERFSGAGAGHHESLEGLMARIEELTAFVVDGTRATALRGGRWRWIAQDLGWRFLQLRADSEGELVGELDALIELLAASPGEEAVGRAIGGYEALAEAWEVPPAEDVLAVGYPLPGGYGSSVRQLGEGVRSACPVACELLGDQLADTVAAFTVEDRLERRPIGRRFADLLGRHAPTSPVTMVARYEAAVTHARSRDAAELNLGFDHAEPTALRLASGVELCVAPPGALGDEVDAAVLGSQLVAIVRDVDGAVGVHALSEAGATALARLELGPASTAELELPPEELLVLMDAALVAPLRWGV